MKIEKLKGEGKKRKAVILKLTKNIRTSIF